MIRLFNTSVLGASHVSSGKPCQDTSKIYSSDELSIITVSDGHGSDTYVRSDKGSELACKIAIEETCKFVKSQKNLFESESIISVNAKSEERYKQYVHKGKKARTEKIQQNIQYWEQIENREYLDNEIRTLFDIIYKRWLIEIEKDASLNPFSDIEKNKLGNNSLVKAYGCTLIVCVKTSTFTFAFQIGDGRCFASNLTNEWIQPIPWDSDCFLNTTTSLCEDNPVDSFRYYINSTDSQPLIFIIFSDGLEDSYISMKEDEFKSEALEIDCSNIVREFECNKDNLDAFKMDLDKFLTEKSKKGSRDDMSIACLYDDKYISSWLELNSIKETAYMEKSKVEKLKNDKDLLEQKKEHENKRLNTLKSQKKKLNLEIEEKEKRILELKKEIDKINDDLSPINTELSALEIQFTKTLQELSNAKNAYKQQTTLSLDIIQKLKITRSKILESLGLNKKENESEDIINHENIVSINELTDYIFSINDLQQSKTIYLKILDSVSALLECQDEDSLTHSKTISIDDCKSIIEFVKSIQYKDNNDNNNYGTNYVIMTIIDRHDIQEAFYFNRTNKYAEEFLRLYREVCSRCLNINL